MAKPKCPFPEETLAAYDKIIAAIPGQKRKGAKSAYTSVNGHMFSFLSDSGQLALRLPKEEREAFLKRHSTELCVAYDTVMKEYPLVPDAVFSNPRLMKKYFAMSYAYVTSLEPKPTTRKASKKKATAKKATKKKVARKPAKKAAVKKKAGKKKPATKKKPAKKRATRKR